MDGEEAKRTRGERIWERCPGGQRTQINLGGEKRMGPEPSRTGIHKNLNIRTESGVQIADALGKELHHTKMSKLWDSKTGPTDRENIVCVMFSSLILVYLPFLLMYSNTYII